MSAVDNKTDFAHSPDKASGNNAGFTIWKSL